MGKIISTPLPKDLPENWNENQYVSPGGTEVGLSEQHGYNYLMKQVNNAQKAIEELDSCAGKPNGFALLDNEGNLSKMPTPSQIGAATTQIFTVALIAAGWSDTAPYTQTVAVSGILATDSPIVDIVLSEGNETAELEAWGYIGRIGTAADSITATCFENKPSIDLNIQIKVVR